MVQFLTEILSKTKISKLFISKKRKKSKIIQGNNGMCFTVVRINVKKLQDKELCHKRLMRYIKNKSDLQLELNTFSRCMEILKNDQLFNM